MRKKEEKEMPGVLSTFFISFCCQKNSMDKQKGAGWVSFKTGQNYLAFLIARK